MEKYITEMAIEAKRIVASTQSQGHMVVERQVEQLLGFVIGGCAQEFHHFFKFGDWLATKTLKMLDSCSLLQGVEESQV